MVSGCVSTLIGSSLWAKDSPPRYGKYEQLTILKNIWRGKSMTWNQNAILVFEEEST